MAPVTPSSATYVDAGEGQYEGAIDWLEWGVDGASIANGSTSVSTRTLNDQPLTISCVASNVEGQAEAYRSGRWKGDALPMLYSKGSPESNTLVAGIANKVDGTTVRFKLDCTATYGGAAVPISGLVVSDAESNNSAQGEYVRAQPTTPSTWRLLDRARDEGCTTATRAKLTTEGTLTLDSDGPECTYQRSAWKGPVATAFMEGATGASFELKGGGRSAVAVGVVLASDFGDAPESYGDAGAFIHQSWEGGVIPVGTSNLFTEVDFARGVTGNVGLGSLIDAEEAPNHSEDARGDDENGQADEDLIIPARFETKPGATFTLPGLVCGTDAQVAGWVDWNRDGAFEEAERSETASCDTGSATLSWQVPSDSIEKISEGASFIRIRSSSDAAQLTSPVGMTADGEVEDHAVELFIPSPALQLSKSADPVSGSIVAPGEVVTYTVIAENTGNQLLDPVTITDDMSGVLRHATYNEDVAASVGETPTLVDSILSWEGQLDPGQQVAVAYSVTVNESSVEAELMNLANATGQPPEGDPIRTPEVSTVHPLLVSHVVIGPRGDPEPEPEPEPGPEPEGKPGPEPKPKQPPAQPPLKPSTPPVEKKQTKLAATGAEQAGLPAAAFALAAGGALILAIRQRTTKQRTTKSKRQ